MFGSGRPLDLASRTKTWIILNEEMTDIIEIVNSFEEPASFTKGASETIQNEAKEQKSKFFWMLLDTLGGSLLGTLLTDKNTIRSAQIFNVNSSFNKFWNTKYYQNEPKFNGVYSRNSLPKIKEEAYVINLDEFKSIGTHWIALYVNRINTTYFDTFGVEHILKEIKKSIGNKNIITNIYRT